MSWTTKVLVIANRTVDSEEVREAIVSRAAAGPLQVTLVAPASDGGNSVRERRAATAQRLDRAVQRLREAGVAVDGIVGDADPIVAVQEAWDPRHFDEIIVATLPTGVSRWMAADLPRRVERFSGARVAHVVATPGRRGVAAVADRQS
jgi:GABA permease